MLSNAFKGYNCCIFAYGETGSGKSHFIFGNHEERGIIFKFAKEMFNLISNEGTDIKS
jgi:kinesin family member 1